MSGQGHPNAAVGPGAKPGESDPSMEDILASIRRILSEDDSSSAAPEPHAPAPARAAEDDNILNLDAFMIAEEPAAMTPSLHDIETTHPVSDHPTRTPEPTTLEAGMDVQTPGMHVASPQAPFSATITPPGVGLVAPEAAAAAASSVGSLLRTLSAERQTLAISRTGPTIEDLVREELRPLLKQWLDKNLPPVVERLVRVEIERVVGRAIS